MGINTQPFLLRKAGQSYYNISSLDMKKLMGDQDHIRENIYTLESERVRNGLLEILLGPARLHEALRERSDKRIV